MPNLFTLTLNIPRTGGVVSVQSLPLDSARKTLLMLAPVGTQSFYLKNAALFFIKRFNLIILESDALLSYASATELSPSEAIIDCFEQLRQELPDHFHVDALVGYCSSAPLALLAAAHGVCRTLLLLNGAYFLPDDGIAKSQYERDVERMMQSIHLGNWAQVYEAVSLVYANSRYTPDDYRYQQVRPLRDLQAFQRYLTALNQLATLKIADAARAVDTPTLVWCGGNDRYTDTASSKHVAKWLAHAQLTEDPAGQHHDFVDGHEPLYQAMTSFLSRHASRAIP